MLNFFRKKANKRYVSDASVYLKENYESPDQKIKNSLKNNIHYSLRSDVKYSLKGSYSAQSVDEFMQRQPNSINQSNNNRTLNHYVNPTFVEYLCEYIREKNLKDPQVYKAAHLDRRLFSKIMSDSTYQPAKDTVIALAFALRLNLNEVNSFLFSAGYALSHSIQRDVIIEYFFRSGIYNLSDINAVLEEMGQKEIGR